MVNLITLFSIKLLTTLTINNFLCLFIFNIFHLPVPYLGYTYIILGLSLFYWISKQLKFKITYIQITFSKMEKVILFFAIISILFPLIFARLGYILESNFQLLATLLPDDHQHIGGVLTSLIYDKNFPIHHYLDPTLYLSYFYAPMLFPMMLYQVIAITGFTLKSAMFIYYAIFISLQFILFIRLPLQYIHNKTHYYFFLLLAGISSGLGHVALTILKPLNHVGHWMGFAGFSVAFPRFITWISWSHHHMIALSILFLMYFFYRNNHKNSFSWKSTLILSLLLSSLVFSSIFVLIGALPYIGYIIYNDIKKKYYHSFKICFIGVLFCLPLSWLFFNRLPPTSPLYKGLDVSSIGPFYFPFFSYPSLFLSSEFYQKIDIFLSKINLLDATNLISFCFMTPILNSIFTILIYVGLLCCEFYYFIPLFFLIRKNIFSIHDKFILISSITILLSPLLVITNLFNDLTMRAAGPSLILFSFIISKHISYLSKVSRKNIFIISICIFFSLFGFINELGFLIKKPILFFQSQHKTSPKDTEILRINFNRNISHIDYSQAILIERSSSLYYIHKHIKNYPLPLDSYIRQYASYGPSAWWPHYSKEPDH